jgi:serine/threonine protein phosphatase 1
VEEDQQQPMIPWHVPHSPQPSPRVAERYPPAPDGWTIYVIGDIHGRLDLLKAIQNDIDADKAKRGVAQPLEVYLGDYIDRGGHSAAVLSALVDRAGAAQAVFLRGNHEQLLLDFLAGRDLLEDWKLVGAVPTLLSYGLPARLLAGNVPEQEVRLALAERLPEAHYHFLTDSRSYCELDPYLMVHAGVRPGIRLEDQHLDDLLGIRHDFLDFAGDFDFTIVHGHTPVAEPDFRRGRINIDTGAFATNRLTCLRIDQDGPRILGPAAK